ncbi:MAG: UvrD-helicase domain-containing protein [Candidatus Tectomicrobia bacterium]|uniref:DNA 3'-5' helicase n=1 Tax=Tectimicrobiota bacterium TaxID=2528274 RepID=A0A932FUH4_UNCTE|nr:UvrD-helicase domain-containing protein [Candidatus Tectomicrobia bacterium]
MDFLEQLNPDQRAAVEHVEGPLLILAGAGSGKTRVITYRIAYLIQQMGADPQSILALTFTNKAAGEMKERVKGLLGPIGGTVWISTFHSACVRILRREIDKLGYTRDFAIYDADDQLSLIKECMLQLDLNPELYPAASIAEKVRSFKNQGRDPLSVTEEFLPFSLEGKALQVYALLQKKLKANNALDFDDLLLLTLRLFEGYPEVLARYQTRFRYLLVDEYQDTNPAQYRLLRLLTQAHRNLCVVGDDDQSIYKWRGADIRNILDFERDFPAARVVKLEENYRSTQTILEAAGAVVAANRERKGKQLWTRRGPGHKIAYFQATDEQEEASYICRTIAQLRAQGSYGGQEIAVLYRTNAQSRPIEEALQKARIPYRVVGGLRFYDRKEIKDVLAYLRVATNPCDFLSLKRILNVPPRGLGKAAQDQIAQQAQAVSGGWPELFQRLLEGNGLPAAMRERLRLLQQLLEELDQIAHSLSASQAIEETIRRTGYDRYLMKEGGPEAESRRQNVQELITAAQQFETEGDPFRDGAPEGLLKEFLDGAALSSPEDAQDDPTGRISLMTLHSSKGLEFPVVFICGMENHLFPHVRSAENPSQLEEERRLCYVGMTRAKELLFLTNAAKRRLYGIEMRNLPSLFLDSIPDRYLQRIAGPTTPKPGPSSPSPAETGASTGSGVQTFRKGTRVYHPKWGAGVIVEVEGEGNGLKVTVAFQQGEKKKLAAKYAPLRLI